MKIHCQYTKLFNPKELKQHPKNRNKHSEDQIDRLIKILEYQGWRYPIKVSERSGFITSGHGRLMAAIKMNLSEVPVSLQDYDSDEQEYADVQSDNAIALWSELDLSGINLDLGELGPDFDIDLLGIKNFTLDVSEKGQCDEDEVPEVVEPITRLGDRYALGDHRLLCGDSTDILQVERLMDGEKADMVCADPPYGHLKIFNKDGQVGGDNKKGRVAGSPKKYHIYKNEGTFKIRPLLDSLKKHSEKLIIWGGNYFADELPITTGWLCWDKSFDKGTSWFSDFELAWTNLGIPARIFKHTWQGMVREGEKIERVHPTQKPIELYAWILNSWTKQEDSILEPFGGSGSTLIACEKTNRKCFMMELDPHYCDVIVSRWEKYTGKKAELINA